METVKKYFTQIFDKIRAFVAKFFNSFIRSKTKNMNNKIVFINQCTGYLTVDIVNAFADTGKYEKIALISGGIKESDSLNSSVKLSFIKPYNKKTKWKRTKSWTIGTIQSLFLVLFKYRGYHLFLFSNPPTTSFITLFCRNTYSTLIYDVYPEGLVLAKFISRKSLINKLWSKFNRRFYRKAKHIFTITKGMSEGIKKYNPDINVQVIPLWNNSFSGIPEDKSSNNFINMHGLQNKFIVMYSGNMGKGHDIETLVQIARILKTESEIVFVFIGDGWKKPLIFNLINDLNLRNCLLLPLQPVEMLPHSLSAADIAVVISPAETENVCTPSKVYNMLALGKPILSIAGKKSEMYRLTKKYDFGICYSNNNISDLVKFVIRLKHSKHEYQKYHKKSLIASNNNFTIKNTQKFVKALETICPNKK